METNQTSQKQMEEKFSYKINLPEHEDVGDALDIYGLIQSARESFEYEMCSMGGSNAKLFLDRAISKMHNLIADIAKSHAIINSYDQMVYSRKNIEEMRIIIQQIRDEVKKNGRDFSDLIS